MILCCGPKRIDCCFIKFFRNFCPLVAIISMINALSHNSAPWHDPHKGSDNNRHLYRNRRDPISDKSC